MQKLKEFNEEINELTKSIKTMSEKESLKVFKIYLSVIERFKNIDKSYFIDEIEYEQHYLYCRASQALWDIELQWLKKQSNLAVDHKYLQITEGLNRISTMLYILRYNKI